MVHDRPLIRLQGITREYPMGSETIRALRGVDMNVDTNEFLAVTGPSGSGKSTLMNVLGLLDAPSSGRYWLNGRDVARLSHSEQARVRGRQIGFVFQTFELLPRQTALRNVELPLLYSGTGIRGRRSRAREALSRVGLGDRMDHRPNQMSGGQCQRVAIARALVQNPSLLLADEPTGNLDTHTSNEIFDLFVELHRQGQTILIVTHEPEVAEKCHRIVQIRDGQIASDVRRPVGLPTVSSQTVSPPIP
jgi:putative ABC transport system ATP-binding protein